MFQLLFQFICLFIILHNFNLLYLFDDFLIFFNLFGYPVSISGPQHIRSTMYTVPDTPDMKKQTGVPFGLVISPLADTLDGEYPPPIVNLGELGRNMFL